jgi:hypothetical protein
MIRAIEGAVVILDQTRLRFRAVIRTACEAMQDSLLAGVGQLVYHSQTDIPLNPAIQGRIPEVARLVPK